jgi:predicted AlkP superfamily pyrophosphatase or phosphodiesterase
MRRLNPFNCWLLFVGILLVSCGSPIKESDHSGKSNKLLLISFDGFMNEYIERNETPNFDRLIANGVKAEYMIPIFPTKTFPNHYSIVTGLYTENHGIIANGFYDDSLDARFRFGPIDSPNDERWWGGEPIWITAEKQGLTSATFFWPGSEASIDGVQSTKWVQYDESILEKARIDSIVNWMDPEGLVQADFGSLYFSFVDQIGHRFGPNSIEVDNAVLRADSLLGYLFEKVDEHHFSDQLNTIVLSDHGMAEVAPERLIFLEEIINMDDVDMIDWTPVAMISPHEGKVDEVYNDLKSFGGDYSVYRKDELPENYHFSNHYRIPEIIVVADMGHMISTRSFYEERGLIKATHGYDYQAPEMRTIFLADGPAFEDAIVTEPFQSIHIYELMCKILELDPAENDGNLEQVKQLLKN